MPGEDFVAPRADRSAETPDFWRAGTIGEVLDDVIDPVGGIDHIGLPVYAPHNFLCVPS